MAAWAFAEPGGSVSAKDMPGRSCTPLTVLSVSEGQRCRHAPPGPSA
ncbi:Uncharacterised protein [Mycobacteroides abscessus subsp. abscessus]|nr:Uncharacterised protein [Mycobacteroides abscessus subsp. abscessus]